MLLPTGTASSTRERTAVGRVLHARRGFHSGREVLAERQEAAVVDGALRLPDRVRYERRQRLVARAVVAAFPPRQSPSFVLGLRNPLAPSTGGERNRGLFGEHGSASYDPLRLVVVNDAPLDPDQELFVEHRENPLKHRNRRHVKAPAPVAFLARSARSAVALATASSSAS